MNTYQFDWTDDGFEFSGRMPEELLVKAMNSTRPIFLTDEFMTKLAAVTAEQVVRDMITDLHRDSDADDTGDVLRWHYLFMDFERDFPRLMAMQPPRDEAPEG